MNKNEGLGFVFGLMVGALVGASVAILLAPQSGEETREILREKAVDARRKAKEFAVDFRDDAEEWVEKGRKYIDEAKSQIMDRVEKTKAIAAKAKIEAKLEETPEPEEV